MSNDLQVDKSAGWMTHMRLGNFEEAWKLSDSVLQSHAGKPCWHLPRHQQYIWDGSSLQGNRVLVRCYHGLGDTIQYIRFAPLLKSIAKEVIIWAQPELIPLLETADGIDRILPLSNGAPDVDFDTDVEIMELTHVFRTTVQALPARVPYLHVDPVAIEPGDHIKVGIVWKSGDWDQRRAVPFSLLAPLAAISGINLHVLQAGAKSAGWQEGIGFNPGGFDLFNYARFIKGLDLLVSVDSMPAHLAGALGVPVWNLLHSDADWRWMDNRSDSPWYPTMRLFRQKKAGDWEGVIEEVKRELKILSRPLPIQHGIK